MARTLQHNRSSTALDARPGTLQDRNGKTSGPMQGITKGCNPEKQFTPVDVEYSVLRALSRMAVPEPVSLCFHVTYAETQTNNLGVSLDAVS